MTRTTARLARLTGGLIAGAVVLTGCAGEDGPAVDAGRATAPAEGFNDADVAFAQGMIPHHEGALTMAEVAVDRAQDPRVRDLAERIEAGQDPEIDLMTGWLEQWGQPIAADDTAGMDHGGSGHGDMDMDGMDMADMPPAGADFDRMWLQSMVEHHDGAVVMAGTELEEGQDDEAVDLARLIVETQTQEIEEMQRLLDELGG
ncbi:DUF305 domain-containing protein [Modestobacter marinus]|uniref:DUF305 domain-containing protein n=1 Tax=Modestobacter marinus TaxID=477641 RepID=A0A846LRV4_9ACTN|nr:DUF305 domain-containing protein [Modestobacter marinus]NIH70117.1 uncharacterized protein (DUF305 family) [Modestobacter marinus]GGL84091.1 DUF305 domain-containing protein [Modestobacter marinus]